MKRLLSFQVGLCRGVTNTQHLCHVYRYKIGFIRGKFRDKEVAESTQTTERSLSRGLGQASFVAPRLIIQMRLFSSKFYTFIEAQRTYV